MKTVFTSGVFDLFHVGHLNFLKQSKSYGNRLIIAVNTDEFTFSYKNKTPIIPFTQRMEMLSSCKYVDLVLKAEEYLPLKYIKEYNVDVITVGSDWINTEIESIIWAKNNNVDVKYINYTHYISTSYIINKIKQL